MNKTQALRPIKLVGALFLLYVGVCFLITLGISVYITHGFPIYWLPDYLQFIVKDVLLYGFMYQRTYILFFGIAILFVGLFATLGGIVMIAELTNEIRRTVGYARERIVVKHEGVVVHDSTVTKPILKLPHHDFTIAFQGLTPQIFHDPVTKKSWAQCNKCGHKIYFTPQTVMHKNFPVTAPTLTLPDKCEECGNTIRTIEE